MYTTITITIYFLKQPIHKHKNENRDEILLIISFNKQSRDICIITALLKSWVMALGRERHEETEGDSGCWFIEKWVRLGRGEEGRDQLREGWVGSDG